MIPKIVKMDIYPVAGHDSMELNLSGAHAPFFTRNIVVLEDSSGNLGVGEVPGGQKITAALEGVKDLVLGSSIGDYKGTLNKVRAWLGSNIADDVRGLQTFDLRTGVHVVTAIEAPLLDLLGKYLEVPAAALMGDGIQRGRVRFLSYLFYIGDRKKTDLPYMDEGDSPCAWYRLRNEEALTPDAIVALAEATVEKYGFEDFKLKGGVLAPKEELKAVQALKKAFPNARVRFGPQRRMEPERGAGNRRRPQGMPGLLRRPRGCGKRLQRPRGAGRVPPRDDDAHRHQHGQHRLAADVPRHHTAKRGHPPGRPPLLDDERSVRVGQLCNDFGLMWGCHSNNHFDISLAMVVQCAAAIPGRMNGIDTHWIWQEGRERLTREPLQIEDGCIALPRSPALGIDVDIEQVKKAHALYLEHGLGARNDAIGMQYLIPGWKFDNKKPCLVR